MPNSDLSGSRSGILTAMALLALPIFIGITVYLVLPSDGFDSLFRSTLSNTDGISAYAEEADTDVVVNGKRLVIQGVYRLDYPHQAFASDSTTTLLLIQDHAISRTGVFTLRNVSYGDDVYFAVDTKSKQLAYINSGGNDWRHFKKEDIKGELRNVAVYGPILDDLALFKEKGRSVANMKNLGRDASSTLVHYTLTLSGKNPSTRPTLQSLIEHIGKGGSIDVWIDEKKAMIHMMHFSGLNYESTTTILNTGQQNISPPVLDR